jgi:hypothetical protein
MGGKMASGGRAGAGSVGESPEPDAWQGAAQEEGEETVIEDAGTIAGARRSPPEKKRQKKKARLQKVRCPYCFAGLALSEADEPERLVAAHLKKCWWLEKNGRGHIELNGTPRLPKISVDGQADSR